MFICIQSEGFLSVYILCVQVFLMQTFSVLDLLTLPAFFTLLSIGLETSIETYYGEANAYKLCFSQLSL